ncbi:hypothetical protein [Nonomuraea composti]|uniref:hypothetical protein n=1 Tax=Nonomuraea composti TaxID=2720023 RepID=UPI001980D547|nr:hypothetical protein [Nonomuraea sp. FMUSA5-5]
MAMLDVHAEPLAAGDDPGERFPGIHAHLPACGPCAQDLKGLLPVLIVAGLISAWPAVTEQAGL